MQAKLEKKKRRVEGGDSHSKEQALWRGYGQVGVSFKMQRTEEQQKWRQRVLLVVENSPARKPTMAEGPSDRLTEEARCTESLAEVQVELQQGFNTV